MKNDFQFIIDDKMSWQQFESVVYFLPNYPITKIAAFDLDNTLIVRKNGSDSKFRETDPSNWIFLGPIPEALNFLYQDGWFVMIITNQSQYNEIVHQKIENVRQTLQGINGWSPAIFIATKKDHYRKPNIQILNLLANLTSTFSFGGAFCGDSCDSPSETYPPYKWGSDDLQFASNCGFNFIRPIDWIGSNRNHITIFERVIIMMGVPGCGKSTLANDLLRKNPEYVVHSKDIEKTKIKKKVIESLSRGMKVIIDATHPSIKSRNEWREFGPVAIIWIITDGRPFNKLREHPISHFAYSSYTSNFQEPSNQEGRIIIVY
jgi:DNA 3'-phosphatase